MFSRTIKTPELTLPPVEAEWIKSAYSEAEVILEYGSGGSTMLAAGQQARTIFSVESDEKWAASMARLADGKDMPGTLHMHHVDIGRTTQWGMPRHRKGWRGCPSYCLSVWDRPDFQQPDTVLIDGRFRVGCFLAVLFRTKRPLALYFDDYDIRPRYHIVEKYAPKAETRGRMARFDITPTAIPADRLTEIITYMHEPF